MTRTLTYLHSIPAERLRSLSDRHLRSLQGHGVVSVANILLNHPVSWHSAERGDLTAGVVAAVERGDRPSILVRAADGTEHSGVWIGQPWAVRRFRVGQRVVMWGKRYPSGAWFNPQAEEGPPPEPGQMGAVWRRRGNATSAVLRRAAEEALSRAPDIADPLPSDLRSERGFPSRTDALRRIAFPPSAAALRGARRRLVYEEFARILLRAPAPAPGRAVPPSPPPPLPWPLTDAQRAADRQIADDQASDRRMFRLLHGEVGSGKTALAALAARRAADAGWRTLVMAPTEILARQLRRTMSELAGVPARLETSDLLAAERRANPDDAPLVVGTHALLHRPPPERVGLVIIDEQHRFGAEHRRRLVEAHPAADRLIMSATPIPRSLSQTLYGDLSVSTLDELPPGRLPSVTERGDFGDAAAAISAAAAAGRPSFLVCPKISRGERAGWSVEAAAERLRALAPHLRTETLTGRVRPGPRDRTMAALREGGLDAVVATSVVEVGVDVPLAAVMAVADPHRFGLAALHQLRGRVGRADLPSRFLLICERAPGDDAPLRPGAAERLDAVSSTDDGFRLAEIDLSLRGPGESWGAAQSGGLGLARPIEDGGLLGLAAADLPRLGGAMREEAEAFKRIVP